jgi:hypothetical protein
MADQKAEAGLTTHVLESEHPAAREVPCILVIFGGAGDLSHRKLLPALYNLMVDKELPDKFAIVGFSMEKLDDDAYRQFARQGVEEFSRQKIVEDQWAKFAPMLHFVSGGFTDATDYTSLKKRLDELDGDLKTGGNRIFYFAVPPRFIGDCADGLNAAGLINPPDSDKGLTRVVVEKPIGRDLASAISLNRDLAAHFEENQIFRIDHYLGKETVENLMALRFANAIFEPLWSQHFIDHVQITVAEQEGVGTRASYYDQAGALRDMVQSHIVQVLCIFAMEPPRSIAADAVSTRYAHCDRSTALMLTAWWCAASTWPGPRMASQCQPTARKSISALAPISRPSSPLNASLITGAGQACLFTCARASGCRSERARSLSISSKFREFCIIPARVRPCSRICLPSKFSRKKASS